MNDLHQDAAPTSTPPLHRPRENRIISGTAIGLAQKLGLPPILVRAAFVVLAFPGIGIPLYIVSWLLIPEEGETESIGARWLSKLSGSQAWLGVALVVVAVAILASAIPFIDGGFIIPTGLLVLGILLYRGEFRSPPAGPPSPVTAGASSATTRSRPPTPRRPPTPPSPLGQITIGLVIISLGALALIDRASPLIEAHSRHYLALTVTVIGLGVLVGTRYGRARWLIPLGLILIPVAVVAGVAEVGRTSANQLIAPTAFADLRSDYDLSAGRLVIDLQDLPWEGQVVEFRGEVGVGSLEVILPPDVGIEAATEVGIGSSRGPVDSEEGLGVDYDYAHPDRGGGLVVVDLEVGIGEIEVTGVDPDIAEGVISLQPQSGDMVINASDPASLAPDYQVGGDANLSIDLSRIELTEDLFLDLTAQGGTISVLLPEDASYTIAAISQSGNIEVFDNNVEEGGVVNSESRTGTPIISINASTIAGDILITEGGRS
jgi:phage shock protein PspC (stress-responsive transcriptional regulator)